MVLSDHEILKAIEDPQIKLIENTNKENIRNCGYTLRIGKIFQPSTGNELLFGGFHKIQVNNGKQKLLAASHSLDLGPSETAIIMTKEKVTMPGNICGTFSSLNSLVTSGLLLINSSLVEPGYSGYLSCFLVNFSSKTISLSPNDKIAKIVFHQLKTAPQNLKEFNLSEKQYSGRMEASAKKFHSTFMNMEGVVKISVSESQKSVRNSVRWGGAIIAILLFWATLQPLITKWIWPKTNIVAYESLEKSVNLKKDLLITDLKTKLNSISEKSNQRDQELSEIKNQLQSLAVKLDTQGK